MCGNRFFAVWAGLFVMSHALLGQTIDLAGDDTLKGVFASGLRPWRYGGTTTDQCEISDTRVTLLLPGGRKISSFPVDNGSFRVFGDYALSQANFSSGLQGVTEAAALAKQVAGELGISSKGIEELAAQANPTRFTSPRQWAGEISLGQINAFLRFMPIPRFNDVKAMVELRLNWKRPAKGARYWMERMPPPPGYEEVGFGTPPPPKGPQVPNPGPGYHEALIRAKKGDRPAPRGTSSDTPTPATSQSNATSSPAAAEKPLSCFPMVTVVSAVAAVLGGAVFFFRRRK